MSILRNGNVAVSNARVKALNVLNMWYLLGLGHFSLSHRLPRVRRDEARLGEILQLARQTLSGIILQVNIELQPMLTGLEIIFGVNQIIRGVIVNF